MASVELKLPLELCQRAEERLLSGSDWSLEDLVVFVLEQLTEGPSEVDRSEEEFLRQRLRSLGYLSEE